MVEEMNDILVAYINNVSIKKVLERCVCDRHGHQYCIPSVAVSDAVNALSKCKFVKDNLKEVSLINRKGKICNVFNDFEELYDFIRSVIGTISGIGPLTVYDTARRLGHLFDTPIYPQMYVYLAAGAKEGAKSLLGPKELKFRESIDLFRPYFGTFPSIFIEDMLCIFKDVLNKGIGKATYQSVNRCSKKVFNNLIDVPAI